VEARRLRKKLDEYYLAHADDPVVIQLPKGGYSPAFEIRLPKRAPRRYLIWAGAGALAVICAVLGYRWIAGRHTALPELALARLTSDHGLTTDPALSPDGATVVYASDRASTGGLDIWIQPVRSRGTASGPRRLTDDPADDSQPAISPDQQTIAFRSERQPPGIYAVPVSGGHAKLLAPDGRNPRYSPDGRWIAYWVGSPGGSSLPPAGKAYVIPAGGGASRRLLGNFASAACPVWSPQGGMLAMEAMEAPADRLDLWSVSLDDERPAPTGLARVMEQAHLTFALRECSLSWAKDTLVFSGIEGDTQNLWRVRVSTDAKPSGPLVRTTLGSAQETLPFAASPGDIAFASRTETLDIWRLPVDRPEQLTRVTEGVSMTSFPQARGHGLAFLAKTEGRPVVWLKDLNSGQAVQLTRPPVQPQYSQLCADGETVVYSDGPNAFAVSARSPVPRLICNGCSRVWQCNDRELLYVPAGSKSPVGIDAFSLQSGARRPLLKSPRSDLANAQKSGDGWVAFHAINGATQRQIFVAPYHAAEGIPELEWIPVTGGNQLDRNAVWNERSDTLYFLSERCGFRCIWAQHLDPSSKKPAGAPAAVRHFHTARLGLTAIGDVGAIGLSYTGGYLYFALEEQNGDTWLARQR
jgi:Tol biopolymer transport system component